MDEIIERIIQLTKDKGISGAELGQKLGLKKTPLTDWKNKKAKPTLEQIIKLCEYFGISADYLIFGKENTIESYNILTKEDKELIDLILRKYKKINTMELSTSKIG